LATKLIVTVVRRVAYGHQVQRQGVDGDHSPCSLSQ
jgi:hypothetical protein